MDAEIDPYRVLGVDPSADHEVIAAAYRVLARRHHPDVSPGEESKRRIVEINAAWAILRSETTREAWDREHLATRDRRTGQAASPPPPPAWRGGGLSGSSGSSATSGHPNSEGHPSGPVYERQSGAAPVGPDGKPQWRRGPGGEGAAGPPPGQPAGTVLPFGRHIGWSLGEVARVDPGYLLWLANRAEGAPFKDEIGKVLRGEFTGGSGPLSGNRPRWGRPR
jgi:curved DNA-binding protein CbpA